MVVTADLKPRTRYSYLGGKTITPPLLTVEVVWVAVEIDAIHYRKANSLGEIEPNAIYQTTVTRFLEIVNAGGGYA